MSCYERELEIAIRAVRTAASACRSVQARITPESLEKKDRSPVTVADFASQAIICHELSQAFPHDLVIAEEDAAALRERDNRPFLDQVLDEVNRVGLAGSEDDICGWIDRGGQGDYTSRVWTLDPIDGTKGFLRGEQYAVSLALIVEGRIDVAVLGCPNLSQSAGGNGDPGCILAAVRDGGACQYPLDETHADPQLIHVTTTADPSEGRFCESVESGHSSHGHAAQVADLLGITAEPLRMDSQAKYAVVARGEADIYLRLPTRADYFEKIWDHAGGVLVVEEAGGKVTDVTGQPLDFTLGRELRSNRGVVVTNGRLHDAVLYALGQVGVR